MKADAKPATHLRRPTPPPAGPDQPGPHRRIELTISARCDERGLWELEATDTETGVVSKRAGLTSESRVGRALEAIAITTR